MPTFRAEDLAAWSGGQWTPRAPAGVRGVSSDTRALAPGGLFVALRGDRFDGHAFVGEAFRRGAAAALVETGAALTADAPLLRVADTRRALLDLAAAYRRALAARFLGVTGSVGKTTVKEMTADLLGALGPSARSRGNWNNDIGLPLSLLAMEPDAVSGVFEVAMNRPGEIARLSAVLGPDWGVFTPIGPVHREAFESVEAIAREKSALARALPPEGRAFMSRDDRWFDLLRAAAPCPVVTTSLDAEADYTARDADPATGSFTVIERATGERAALRLPMPGRHMIANALLALAAARAAGVAWAAAREALARYRPPPLRWARETLAGCLIVNDAYNANPVSMRAATEAFALEPVAGRRWLALGGMWELGAGEREEHRRLGRDLAGGPWAGLLVVGPRGAWIAEGARENGGAGFPIWACADTAEAAARWREQSRPGDALLLKASRGERFEQIVERLKEPL